MNLSQWFAPPGVEKETNVHFRARTTFDLATIPARLLIAISAESRYRLWCNGVEVATGPARGNGIAAFRDHIDLVPFVREGGNTIEILAGSANIPTFKIAPIRPALYVELENIPARWQVARDTSFNPQPAKFNSQTGFCEWRDLRVAELDWETPEFFTLEKVLFPRDCAMLKVSTYTPPLTDFPISLEPGGTHVFDFMQEIIGGAEFEIDAPGGAELEIGYGEHLLNGNVPIHLPSEINTYADRFIAREGLQVLPATLQERGFRYLQITTSHAITLKNVRAIDRRYPLPPPDFHCEDKRFNQLYAMAHHTISSNATDVLTDCPWREQALWMNDLIVNALFWLEAGGDPQLVARCLRLALLELNEDGLIYGVMPNGKREELVFLATNAFLPIILKNLSRFDEKIAHSFLPQISEVMRALEQFTDAGGLLVGPEKYWNFLDWSFEFLQHNFFVGRAAASINGFYLLALLAMADLHKHFGLDYQDWQQRADNVAQNLHKRFWNEKRQCYLEFEDDDMCSELAQALACIANRDSAVTKVLCEKLARDNDEFYKPELYMMHFVIQALVENGYHGAAKERLLRYWGTMLENRSITIWEANVHQHGEDAFNGAGSLCHAFSCAPLWALPRCISE